MPTFRISNSAVSDMLDIGRYTEDTWGLEQRNVYLKRLDKAFHSLAKQPKLARKFHEKAKTYVEQYNF